MNDAVYNAGAANLSLPNHPIYGEILKGRTDSIQETRAHIQGILTELEEKKSLCYAEKVLLNTFRRDVTDAFTDCRACIKDTFQAMFQNLQQQQEEMIRELEATAQYNLEQVAVREAQVDRNSTKLELQIQEGHNLLREQDTFTFYAKGTLYRQLAPLPVTPQPVPFRDTFPDLGTINIAPFQLPLQHVVHVNMGEFLKSPDNACICGNIFHNGFRFQLQLKRDQQYLSVYVCLRAWHDVAPFLRITVDFSLALQSGMEILHTATAKNTFEGPNDGWGWNKYLPLAKLAGCKDVMFRLSFNHMSYGFLAMERPTSPSVAGLLGGTNTSTSGTTGIVTVGERRDPVSQMENLSLGAGK
jgi:hypothetical protein